MSWHRGTTGWMARYNRHASAAAAIRPECPQVVRPTDLRIAPGSRRSTGRVRVATTRQTKLRPVRQAIPWINDSGNGPGDDPIPGKALESHGDPGGSRPLFLWATRPARRCGGVARSIAEGLAGAASAAAQCRPGFGHPAVGCLYPQITADQERAALDGADGGRDIRLLAGNTRCLVVQGPGRAAAYDLGYQRRARGARSDPGPLPAIEYLRKPAQALAGMPASLRVEVHGDLTALVRLARPWPG